MTKTVSIVGGGLAGCEAALQLANKDIKVKLYEMKKIKKSPAHSLDSLCELICSNSLKSQNIDTASGLLKEEMKLFHSYVLETALTCKVPAGGALAVDRELFSKKITKIIADNKNIEVIDAVIEDIPKGPCIIATGPLTDERLSEKLMGLSGELYFYDAVAPIISGDSINMDIVYRGERYSDVIGTGDYLNCPMTMEEYMRFFQELITAQSVKLKSFEDPKVFEGCMPVEVMAKRGKDTLCFGPLRPVGLIDPRSGNRPYAVVQLRQEDELGSMYNLVGFQTNLKFNEQKRVFSLIPGLENCEFLRYGVMHRNTYLKSPGFLNEFFAVVDNGELFFAGQITGVEGYVESIASGMMAGINMARTLMGKELSPLPKESMIGALCNHVAFNNTGKFQPMNANFGIIPPLSVRIKDKKKRYNELSNRSLNLLTENIENYN